MKKLLASITGLMFSVGLSAAAGAYTITYNHDLAVNGNDFISPYVNVPVPSPTLINLQTQNFEGTTIAGLTGNFALVTGLTEGYNAPPFGLSLKDQTQYLTVPKDVNTAPVSATMSFGQSYDYLGLWWGSIDSYNTLSFISNNSIVKQFKGSELPTPSVSNGAQTSNMSNQYVNFYGINFDAIMFTSTQYAFEVDNLAVGNVVPEPGTMVLFGFGMLGLAIYGKRRMNKEA